MDLGLQDKVVFIAGASRGIGYGMAEAFLKEGAKVAITGRTEASLDDAQKSLSAHAPAGRLLSIAGDMTRSDAIAGALEATISTLGPLHTVIANVGLGRAPLGFDVSDEDWEFDIRQNLTGAMSLAREALTRVLKSDPAQRDGANLIFISSIAGVDAMGTSLPYAATKAALNHVTKAMAKSVGKEGVRVNAIAPGNILFEGGVWDRNTKERPDAWSRWIKREVALRRFGKVEEIADAALWLASPRASFVTGAVIVVDGGQVR